ncbi:MAG: hypothetical protein JW966_11740 [Anaerolineae bacterium]|nr:hypothetical protein [Anaerolineae bacterium]
MTDEHLPPEEYTNHTGNSDIEPDASPDIESEWSDVLDGAQDDIPDDAVYDGEPVESEPFAEPEQDELDEDQPAAEVPTTAYALYAASSEADQESPEQTRVGVDDHEPAAMDRIERLRQPRAEGFRQHIRNQVSMLPLAVFLIGFGLYMIAREQQVEDVPRLTSYGMGIVLVLALAFAAFFRGLVFGRYERGLLFVGLWTWITAGMIAVVALGIDDSPLANEWWPLLLIALSPALLLTVVFERGHDARLILLSAACLVMGLAAYWVTSGQFSDQTLDDIAGYWPLLLSAAGIGLMPLVFRRHTG